MRTGRDARGAWDRRRFLKASATTLGAVLAGRWLAGCGPSDGSGYWDVPSTLTFPGYEGLAELPFFEELPDGSLKLAVDLPPIIDFHVHLGFAYGMAPAIDLLASDHPIQYFVDCDGATPPCTLDLDVYANLCATDEMRKWMDSQIAATLFRQGSDAAATHTIPNLLDEMDRMGTSRAVVLPIALGLDKGDDATNQWMDAIAAAGAQDRLIAFGSVHPNDPHKHGKLRTYKARGIRGVKVHPTMQLIHPNDPATMAIYGTCQELDLPVLFHSGRAGIELDFMQEFAMMCHYEAPIREFPGVRFILGHAGARLDWEAAAALAAECPNVWLELSGQGVEVIQELMRRVGPERLLFGTDWPFYPEAPMIAKVLIAANGDPAVQRMILRDNALRFLDLRG